MNRPPSILVDTGFEVDQNGALTEIVTPTVVATLDPPKKVTFNGKLLNYIPSTAGVLEECSAPYATSIPDNAFKSYTKLASVNLPSLLSLVNTGTTPSGAFYGCTALTTVVLPSLTTCNDSHTSRATFGNCTSLESVQLGSEGHAVTSLGAYMFKNCTQSNLTITIYTSGGASLAGEPWGATNAVIEYEEA